MTPDPTSAWARSFAREHGVLLRLEANLPGGVPAYKYETPDGAVVVLDRDAPPERQHFALAHEVAHILLDHAGEVADDEEVEANRLASELLLPREQFEAEAHRPLRELKQLYPHASFEAIARRRLALEPGVLTVVDEGDVRARILAEGFAAPLHPTEVEWNLIGECYDRREDLAAAVEGLELEATYVDTGRGVRRVLLFVRQE